MPRVGDRKRFKAVGAHIYAGGFTLGVRDRVKVLCHLEEGDYGAETSRRNLKIPVHVGVNSWPLENLREEGVDFVYCNPPCAPFSMMGPRTTRGSGAWAEDPRLSHWRVCFGLLKALSPGVWACESVTQIYSTGRPLVDELTREALGMGYSVTHLLMDACYCGAAQHRRRFFLLCHRSSRMLGLDYEFRETTVGDVMRGVEDPGLVTPTRPDLVRTVKKTPQGGRLSDVWQRINPGYETRLNAQGKVKGRPSFQDYRLAWDRPMGAYVGDKIYHPEEHRKIGIEEAKAICGYPPGYWIEGRPGVQWGSYLARAVMPPVGRWLAGAVVRTLEHEQGGRRRVTLVDLRSDGRPRKDLTDYYLGGRDAQAG